MYRRFLLCCILALSLAACASEDTNGSAGNDGDAGADLGPEDDLDADTSGEDGNLDACPAGPEAPLDQDCAEPDLECRYGYEPPECGGRTVICQDGTWAELEHTDPQPGCFEDASEDFGPDSDVGTDLGAEDAESDADPFDENGCLTFQGASALCGFNSDDRICELAVDCEITTDVGQCGINCEMGTTVDCYTADDVACLEAAETCEDLEACGFIL